MTIKVKGKEYPVKITLWFEPDCEPELEYRLESDGFTEFSENLELGLKKLAQKLHFWTDP